MCTVFSTLTIIKILVNSERYWRCSTSCSFQCPAEIWFLLRQKEQTHLINELLLIKDKSRLVYENYINIKKNKTILQGFVTIISSCVYKMFSKIAGALLRNQLMLVSQLVIKLPQENSHLQTLSPFSSPSLWDHVITRDNLLNSVRKYNVICA